AAADIARQVINEHPGLDVSLVAGGDRIGANLKVSSLANMYPAAKHPFICIADSDMRVPVDYLARVMSPFEDSDVGAVTCLYTARAIDGWGSRLSAMFVNDWFLPSALVSVSMRSLRYCFGATMALRRDVLEDMGGFSALAEYLADDYMLGQRVYEQGYRIELANCLVENVVREPDFISLLRHELRWARTMRRVEPVGYGLAAVTDVLPMTAIAGLCVYLGTGIVWPGLALVALALVARTALHLAVIEAMGIRHDRSAWLIPARDIMTALLRVWSFIPGPVTWRGHEFDVDRSGRIIERTTSPVAK
ncbi:MAG: glycosyltransferase, partial [Chromatiales bacterium]|nr:glycosyltransferase [Chromatiales bacterium]